MCVVGVIDIQVVVQACFKVCDRTKIPAFEKTPGQHTEPPFDLIQPRSMLGGKMKDMLMVRIVQEGPPLPRPAAGPWARKGYRITGPSSDIPPDSVRVQIIDHPVVVLHGGKLPDDVGQMRCKIITGTRDTEIPHHLPGRYDERGDQGAHAPADIFVFTFSGLPGWAGWVGYLRWRICMPVFHQHRSPSAPAHKSAVR